MNKEKILSWIKANSRILIGIILLVIGVLLVIQSREVILNLILLLSGLLITYYSFYLLRFTKITNFIDQALENIKNKLKRQ